MLQSELQADHVYLTEDAAIYLVQAGIKLVGFDYLSFDRFGDDEFPPPRAALGAGVIIVEGLDLSEVDPGEYDLDLPPPTHRRRGRRPRPRSPLSRPERKARPPRGMGAGSAMGR